MAMPRQASADHRSVQCVKCRKQRRCPVTLVVMSHGATAARHEWKPRLCSVQRLDLALLVYREHQGVLRRIEIETNDVFQFLCKLRVPAEFEAPRQMRLEAMLFPDTADRARAQSH